jgi:hypothetical protein
MTHEERNAPTDTQVFNGLNNDHNHNHNHDHHDYYDNREKMLSYSVIWKYGDKPREDYIEVTNLNKNVVVKLKRWMTFKSFHFPEGAIVTGFRGRRDYKDGKCQGIMCCKWCSEKKMFVSFIFTISNGYNGTFSEKDFETIEPASHSEFTFHNTNAIKNIKSELR